MINQQRLFHKQSLFLHDMYASVFYTHRLFRTKTVIALAVLVFCPDVLYSAEIKGSAITLCKNGYSSNGTCKEYEQGSCANTHLYTGIDNGTFVQNSYNGGSCGLSGYTLTEIPDVIFSPRYNGVVMGFVTTLCKNGYYSGNKCVQYEQKSCDKSHSYTGTDKSTFYQWTEDNFCPNGFSAQELDSETYKYYFNYNGMLLGTAFSLCGAGRWSNGVCSGTSKNDCPTNYVDLELEDTSFTKLDNGVCGSGYAKYTINQQCNSKTTDNICAKLCDADDLLYTDIGTCATLCPYKTQLKAKKADGTEYSFPLYAEKQITPSINFGFAQDQVCYVNLLPGSQQGAFNIQYNNVTYHTVR